MKCEHQFMGRLSVVCYKCHEIVEREVAPEISEVREAANMVLDHLGSYTGDLTPKVIQKTTVGVPLGALLTLQAALRAAFDKGGAG